MTGGDDGEGGHEHVHDACVLVREAEPRHECRRGSHTHDLPPSCVDRGLSSGGGARGPCRFRLQ